MATVYRFKTDPELITELKAFAQKHKFSPIDEYRKMWDRWCEAHAALIADEQKRLEQSGYTKNIKQKLFRSVRYYYSRQSTKPSTPKKRRKYVRLPSTIRAAMDSHIQDCIKNNDYTPARGYTDFAEKNELFLSAELTSQPDVSMDHIKKTYKNRYYLVSRSKK